MFTFTAPYISEEDEKRERENLSEGEAATLRDDVYGSSNSGSPSSVPDHVYEEGTRFVEEAIDSMEDSKKEAYMKAREIDADLMKKECPIRPYLDSTSFDVWKAADMVASYWRLRLSVFGSQRAFIPMTLDSAMADDLDFLQEGTMMYIEDDNRGRPVHFYDRIRLDTRTETSRKLFLRVFFYVHQMRFYHPDEYVALINGRVRLFDSPLCVFIRLFSPKPLQGFDLYKHHDRRFSRDVVAISQVFPGQVKAIHLCIDGSCKSVIDLVLPIVKHIYGKYMRMRMITHSGSKSEILASIQEYGMGEVHVEAVFGGILRNPARARIWLDKRRKLEKQAQGNDDNSQN